jgi:hypothetical protein
LLFGGQSLGPAVAQGLRESSRPAFSKVSDESEDFRDRFAGIVASLAISEAINPLEDDWLQQYLIEVEADRVLWARRLAHLLEEVDSDVVKRVWKDWLKRYWEFRLDGKPPLTSEEAGATIEWIPALQPILSEAVDLICKGPAPKFGQHSMALYQMKSQEIGKRHAHSVTKLLRFVLSEGSLRPWDNRFIAEVIEDIAAADDCSTEEFESLVELAVKRGYLKLERAEELLEEC